jgi:uncharacterized protein YxeA
MKRIISFLLALVLCFTISATAFAELPDSLDGQNEVIEEQNRVEETKWYFRVYDGYIVQKRLWSITYGVWLTDWITIGYIE